MTLRKAFRLLLIVAASAVIVSATYSVAMAADPNASYKCEVTQVSAGDEVRLVVSTQAMSICTFISYVEYDGNLLEYQGYKSASGETSSAYLVDAKGKQHEVMVEHAEDNRPLVGMYMIGAKEVSYSAATPLVTLCFVAKSSGTIEDTSFVTAESTDGTDGYTSESFYEVAGNNSEGDGAEESSQAQSKQPDKKSNALVAIIPIIIIIIATTIAVIKKRKKTIKTLNNSNNERK